MRKRINVETTVVSYYVARPSRDLLIAGHQKATSELWPRLSERYETFISALVFAEAGRGNSVLARKRLRAIQTFRMLDTDDDAQALAGSILAGGGIPEEYPEDALHVAVSAVDGMDAILTWNFAHLNNPFTRLAVKQIVEQAGYRCPEICSPDELLEVDR